MMLTPTLAARLALDAAHLRARIEDTLSGADTPEEAAALIKVSQALGDLYDFYKRWVP